ncbi:hypothetical protein CAEBREN_05397 [Caenorhabditis brenneri]|uniref:Sdz-33 F-box domain-containing protein n=1 Tax=Caenorhabditis brenneri TaxID=135651 RepID=G0MJD6_CAEBE|nr:hypothetical protein CAEBREN_05397 [Caenorhabditis brenneri]
MIPVDHIRYFLEDIKTTKCLDIHLPNNLDFRLDTARFSVDEVFIEHAQWVSRDTFLSMDCSRITLWNECFTQKDIQDFISQWLTSTSTRLVWLKMIPSERITYFDSSMFPTKPWNPNSRGRYFKLEHCDDYNGVSKVDCSGGMDLIRSDGLMATIVLMAYTTYFLVWHDRHHDGTENYPDDYFYW